MMGSEKRRAGERVGPGVKYLRRAAARERSAVICGNLGAAVEQWIY